MKKLVSSVFTALCLLVSTAAFSAEKPEVISSQMAAKEVKIGTVSISGVRGSSDDAVRKLQEKSAELGGSKLRVVALNTAGDSSLWMGNAEVFR
ncbi:DUF1471 domain-containing protein [Enterobacteriaceae bacterium 89]|nr:DUF1471 domain-containing protein [Enterobacteriaceae bacterium 89]